MKKQARPLRKLTLNRETLAPLQAEQLEAVNGGLTPSLIASAVVITVVFCFPQEAR
jgi:hypothetical protein